MRTLILDDGSRETLGYRSREELVSLYDQMLSYLQHDRDDKETPPHATPESVDDYHSQFASTVEGHRFAVTEKGYMGLVPKCAMTGGWICVLAGLPVPYVIRAKSDAYLLIGDACIHGIMHREAVQRLGDEVVDITLQ